MSLPSPSAPLPPPALSSSPTKVFLFPRSKSGRKLLPHKGRRPQAFDLPALQSHFHLPLLQASAALGISVTALKKLSRKLGIGRWPYQRRSTPTASPRRAARRHKPPASSISPPAGSRKKTGWEPISRAWIEWYMKCGDGSEAMQDESPVGAAKQLLAEC
ncbi:hypothetical protein GUITHDRAFT_105729 [Guillardia theta CCMP2712]|uniref:RWP-RK domain-containing protein n=1 Tax=Guillardia theta (strain CCMP2712) TaxID=905079 RepID=L1JKG5_GUITC|nr:hypothetical protein GUITHDRAFT_105729 [Guillardia theta CCMP2712]EKX48585.1 hypothetical protein GUITHDRAFT_105729 [Guillardia theta CCMP2712]|eukprot:XP_005835565.1 hypothetical protein GUITHDRAFT_105729 [Guillardia theta CCMP2712]